MDNNYSSRHKQIIQKGLYSPELFKCYNNRNSEKSVLATNCTAKLLKTNAKPRLKNGKVKLQNEKNDIVLSNRTILVKIDFILRNFLRKRVFLNHNLIVYIFSFLTINELINIKNIYRKLSRIIEIIKLVINQNVLKVSLYSSQLRMMRGLKFG